MDTSTDVQFPKVAIRFCVQCKWNLRAAYFAQELLQTFSDKLGEVSLIPVTGGVFTINLYHETSAGTGGEPSIQNELIWDRKRDGGFPETKELKNRVRNIIDPDRDMGHVDRALRKGQAESGNSKQDEHKENGMGPVQDGELAKSNHVDHKNKDLSVTDCEECREAIRADDQSTKTS